MYQNIYPSKSSRTGFQTFVLHYWALLCFTTTLFFFALLCFHSFASLLHKLCICTRCTSTHTNFLCTVYSYIFACIVLRSLKLPGATTFPNYNVMYLLSKNFELSEATTFSNDLNSFSMYCLFLYICLYSVEEPKASWSNNFSEL